MRDFYLEAVHEIKHPKPLNNNLNKFTLRKLENEGSEIITYLMKNNNIGAAKKNPIVRLYEASKLTRDEFSAAENYQKRFEISQISHHARPVLIYDGLSHSSASSKSEEGGSSQSQIDAGRFIFKVKMALELKNHETQYRNKKFQVVDLQLPQILESIFEKQQKSLYVQQALHLDRLTLQDRVKNICKILVAL